MLGQQETLHSYTSTLLITHSRFADVYGLFESVVGQLPDALTKEFIRDVDQIRGKLDSWKALFTYEKEKTNFLKKKDRRKSFSDIQSLQETASLQAPDGSCDCSVDSVSLTPKSPTRSPSSESMTAPPTPPLTPPIDSNLEQTQDTDALSSVTDTLPLVLDNENDETWLCSVPQDSLESVIEEEVKTTPHVPHQQLEPTPRKKVSAKKPISERIKSSTDWLRTKIPKAPGASKLGRRRNCVSPATTPPSSGRSESRSRLTRSGSFTVELSTQSESRGRRLNSYSWKTRSTTV